MNPCRPALYVDPRTARGISRTPLPGALRPRQNPSFLSSSGVPPPPHRYARWARCVRQQRCLAFLPGERWGHKCHAPEQVIILLLSCVDRDATRYSGVICDCLPKIMLFARMVRGAPMRGRTKESCLVANPEAENLALFCTQCFSPDITSDDIVLHITQCRST